MATDRTQQIVYKPLESLQFDPQNPRLPTSVNGSSEEAVINWMLENENLIELMASIAEKGFFAAEPLLVIEKDNKFLVVEGNRRLTAVKLLRDPDLASIRKASIKEIVEEGKKIDSLTELPVIVFDDENVIQQYLGYRHITGIQPWDSLAKARYLNRIKDSLPQNDPEELYKSLAKTIGSRADHVKLLLTGFDIYTVIENKDFYGIKDLDEKSLKFGVLYTALSNPNIGTFVGVDFDTANPSEKVKSNELEELTRWMFEKKPDGYTKLGESRNLRKLNKVVSNSKALDAFRKQKTLDEAVLLTNEPDEIFEQSITDSLNQLQTARDYMHLINEIKPSYEAILIEIRKLSKTISLTLSARQDDDDEN